MNRFCTIFSWILRFPIAAVFIFSAVSKLMPSAIDEFELYIFSFGFFPLNVCFILARLCIGMELVLALFILFGWFPRTMRLVTSGVLLLFTIFLAYAALIGRDDSCQCFGEMVELNPLQSLLKNAVLLLHVLLYYRFLPPKPRMRSRWIAFPFLLAAGLMVLPFVVSVPDNWYFGPGHQPYNEEALTEWYSNQTINHSSNHTIVAFVTPKCHYCQLARKKLDAIVSRHNIDADALFYVEPQQKKNTPGAMTIPTKQFVEITHGSRPMVFLLDGSKVVTTYHLRNIDEDQIANFFK